MKKLIKKIIRRILLPFKKKSDSMFIDMKFIAKYLPHAPVIIDCGAHNGADSIKLAKIPGSKIYAFEPVSKIYNQLIANTKDFKNISCYNIALGEFDGIAEMYVSSGTSDASSSLLKPKDHITDHPDVVFNEVEKVKCKKLDTWARENNVSLIDMLWLDMQGAEQKMLKASEEILKSVSIIHSEVSIRETYEGVETYSVFKKFLEDCGFDAVIEAIPEGYDMGNVLFIKKNNERYNKKNIGRRSF